MKRKYSVIVTAIVMFIIAGTLLVTANPVIDQVGVLSGPVIDLVATGVTVREGDVLVNVETLTGPMPASRATANGVVTEVLVKNGDSIKIGDVVARIKTGK